ncbi:unnamed protein product [Ilex paraguariensis]|uniref:Uncharacterized protein n=1 Tax=Ilex paraguariensis TaxID=185542 RepID=A0ABC8SBS8_9AQUA
MDMFVKEERKTPARLVAACGYRKIEITWLLGIEFTGEMVLPPGQLALRTWTTPENYMRPLKIETTQRLETGGGCVKPEPPGHGHGHRPSIGKLALTDGGADEAANHEAEMAGMGGCSDGVGCDYGGNVRREDPSGSEESGRQAEGCSDGGSGCGDELLSVAIVKVEGDGAKCWCCNN